MPARTLSNEPTDNGALYYLLSALIHSAASAALMLDMGRIPNFVQEKVSQPPTVVEFKEVVKKSHKVTRPQLPKPGKKAPNLKALTQLSRPLIPDFGQNSPTHSYRPLRGDVYDIDDGYINLLEADSFVYKTFYDRVREKIEPYWRPKVRANFNKLQRTHKSMRLLKTLVLITIDSGGLITDVKVGESSGDSVLDQLALLAFREARDFQNPPEGLTKFQWEFIVIL